MELAFPSCFEFGITIRYPTLVWWHFIRMNRPQNSLIALFLYIHLLRKIGGGQLKRTKPYLYYVRQSLEEEDASSRMLGEHMNR